MAYNALSYRSIASILKNGLDRIETETPKNGTASVYENHAHADYYAAKEDVRWQLNRPLERLREMRLQGPQQTLSLRKWSRPQMGELSFEGRFGLLVDQEWTCRQDRRLGRLLREVKLRIPACIEDTRLSPIRQNSIGDSYSP